MHLFVLLSIVVKLLSCSHLSIFFFFLFFFLFSYYFFPLFFFFKQKTAYEITVWLEFRRVLFRSLLVSFLDLLARGEVLLGGHPGIVAGALDFPERLFDEVEADQQVGERVDRGLISHVREFLRRGQGAAVAVAAADHVDQGNLCLLRSALHFREIAREE